MTAWTRLATHRGWLQQETERLLAFGRNVGQPGRGAAWLDDDGVPDPTNPTFTWITSRMVHVYSLGQLMGLPGCRQIAETCLSGLTGELRDSQGWGWFSAIDGSNDREAYAHAFVVLAASSATIAGLPGGRALLDDALGVMVDHFWDEDYGLVVDVVDVATDAPTDYRGINANMHTVEAFLAAADATGDRIWAQRAARIGQFAMAQAGGNDWRLPEHFDPAWQPLLEYNADQPADQFRPYGATVGHGLEWARLLLHIEATGEAPDVDWVGGAVALYDRALADGWARDGEPGFCYTTNWQGEPVVRDRLHWVAAEAAAAAAVLHQRLGEERFAADYATWWDYIARYLIDSQRGSWHHELTPANVPGNTVWDGKPDLYHAVQATVIPRLPLAPGMTKAIAEQLWLT